MRGIGKTVLLLQLANDKKNSLYISADSTYLKPYSLYDVVRYAVLQGYKNIFIDEIHEKPDWTYDIKTLYDEGEVRVMFTGSSQMEVRKGADLSRRVRLFEMKPASFREYLCIKKGFDVKSIRVNDLFKKEKVKDAIKRYAGLIHYMDEYYKMGGVLYPGDLEDIYAALDRSIERAITHDLASLREIDINVQDNAYKILYLIATSQPFELSYSALSDSLEISKYTAKTLVYSLSRIGLVNCLLPCESSHRLIRKEPKLYLNFPLRYFLNWILGKEPHIGALREEFFANHTGPSCYFKGRRGEKTSDFLVDKKVIEVGGKSKSRAQGPDLVVVDHLTVERGRIPLFLFGLIY
ncbi:MAG: ATP-binding protein [Candidatus Diapherotrites archaeon]|nr:ATP-binding protein [Candidatus Diapherotrites archaeon]